MAEHHNAPPSVGFSEVIEGRVVCRLCASRIPLPHLPSCPIVLIDLEVKALTGHVGLCIANLKDSLETIARLLRDQPK